MESISTGIARVAAGKCDCGGRLGERVDMGQNEIAAVCGRCGSGWVVWTSCIRRFFPHVVDAHRVA